MPIYEYQCRACGATHDVLQKISGTPLKECPSCNRFELTKMISAAGFRLAGSGWYETDFKTGERKKNLLGGSPSSSESDDIKSQKSSKSDDIRTEKSSQSVEKKPTSGNEDSAA